MKKILYNAIVFNIAWFVCILGGSKIAVPFAFVVIGIHLAFFSDNKTEIGLILVVPLFGVVVESIFIRSGLLVPPDGSLWPPLWLICLWGFFATTLNHSLRWFQTHLPIAAVIGAVSAPFTYLAGTRLNDFSLREPVILTLVAMGLVWCIAFPFCLFLAKNLLGDRPA